MGKWESKNKIFWTTNILTLKSSQFISFICLICLGISRLFLEKFLFLFIGFDITFGGSRWGVGPMYVPLLERQILHFRTYFHENSTICTKISGLHPLIWKTLDLPLISSHRLACYIFGSEVSNRSTIYCCIINTFSTNFHIFLWRLFDV